MFLFALLIVSSVAPALACDACVDGRCHSRRTLVRGFQVSGQMALHRTRAILFLQLNSDLITAVHLDEPNIQLVQTLHTIGLAVDQRYNVIYTTYDNKIHKYDYDFNEIEVDSLKPHWEVEKLQFYEHTLYYTAVNSSGLFKFENKEAKAINETRNFTITDFVVGREFIHFVSENRVYKCGTSWLYGPVLVTEKEYILAIDGKDDVYLGDVSTNLIMKLDRTTGRPVEYAAYETGSVDRIVFDGDTNMVFHDSRDGTVNYWKPEGEPCRIDAPHEKYTINECIPSNPFPIYDRTFWAPDRTDSGN